MHIPVLLKEVLYYLNPKAGKSFIDATFGLGGHSKEIAKTGAKVLGIDRDPSAAEKISLPNIGIETGSFSNIEELAVTAGFSEVDGILLDLGMSSEQLDDPKRGFAFQESGPLDMRYDQGSRVTAADLVNNYPEEKLAAIFQGFGEEKRFGKKVARAIVLKRKTSPIKSTEELFELIKRSLPRQFRHKAADIARRIFQSLRIEVNSELDEISLALPQTIDLLKKGGRLAIISFHSLEDRLVKKFFLEKSKDCVCPKEFPICRCGGNRAKLKILTKKPITASQTEIKNNPRSKSAKMRVAEKK